MDQLECRLQKKGRDPALPFLLARFQRPISGTSPLRNAVPMGEFAEVVTQKILKQARLTGKTAALQPAAKAVIRFRSR